MAAEYVYTTYASDLDLNLSFKTTTITIPIQKVYEIKVKLKAYFNEEILRGKQI